MAATVDWSKLMQLALEGDNQAYHDLLTDITRRLRPYFAKRIGDREEIEDLIQEVLTGIHSARHTYDVERPFAQWMFAIAHYKTMDHFRRRQKEAGWIQFEQSAEELFEQELFDNNQLEIRLKAAIEQLPQKQRDVFICIKLQGLSVRQTAERTQTSESAVKVNAHRAYRTVKMWILEQQMEEA